MKTYKYIIVDKHAQYINHITLNRPEFKIIHFFQIVIKKIDG